MAQSTVAARSRAVGELAAPGDGALDLDDLPRLQPVGADHVPEHVGLAPRPETIPDAPAADPPGEQGQPDEDQDDDDHGGHDR
ncbi:MULTISPECIES: hypothetical protein [unclassified Modestobacter]